MGTLCNSHDLFLLEDAAQFHGATQPRHCGRCSGGPEHTDHSHASHRMADTQRHAVSEEDHCTSIGTTWGSVYVKE